MDQQLVNAACYFVNSVIDWLNARKYGVDCGGCNPYYTFGVYKSVESTCEYTCITLPESQGCDPASFDCTFTLTDTTQNPSCGTFSLSLL